MEAVELNPDAQLLVRAVEAMTPSGKVALALLAFHCHKLGGGVGHPEAAVELEKVWAVMRLPSRVQQN